MKLTQNPGRLLLWGIVILALASCAANTIHYHVWRSQAEAAVRDVVSATAKGESAKNVESWVDKDKFPGDFALPYEIVGPDDFFPMPKSLSDLLEAGVYDATLHFANGHVYVIEAFRWDNGLWQVGISLPKR